MDIVILLLLAIIGVSTLFLVVDAIIQRGDRR